MGNNQNSAVLELGPECTLNQIVRLQINVGRRLIQHEHLAVSNDGTSHADQLFLTHWEQIVWLVAVGGQAFG